MTQPSQAPQNGVVEQGSTPGPQPTPETPSTDTPNQTPKPEYHGRPTDDSDPGHS